VPGLSGLGSYEGTFVYVPLSAGDAELTITLTNTSPADNGGYLTALAFNNPGGRITGATLTPSNTNFQLLGAPGFSDGVNGSSFGHFDLGASTSNAFLGGGNPNKGIGVGQTATFLFVLTGSDLDGLDVSSFFTTLSAPPGDGSGNVAFVGRFRGFNDGGSDKVPGVDPPVIEPPSFEPPSFPVEQVPEPAAWVLAAVGAGLALAGWRARRS
jgi:hypothetical protein